MLSKKTILTVVIFVAVTAVISFGINAYKKQDEFKLKNIPYQSISYIEVMNRSRRGKPVLFFRNRDSINQLTHMLLTSLPVQLENINWKNNKGGCEIVLHLTNKPATVLTYVDMKGLGGIISSGAYNYRNDTLLRFFQAKFKQ